MPVTSTTPTTSWNPITGLTDANPAPSGQLSSQGNNPGTGGQPNINYFATPTNPVTNPQTPAQGQVAGQIAAAKESGFINGLPPSLQGLYGGSTTGTSGSTGTTGTSGTTGASPTLAAGGTGVAGGSGVSGGGAPQISPTDMTASNAATFANAKNQVGQTSRASLDALNGELGSEGMLGGGAAVQGARDVVNAGQTTLGGVTNQNAITDAAQAQADAIANQTATTAYNAQQVQQQKNLADEALASNNQQFQQSYLKQQQLQNMLQMALTGLGGSSGGGATGGMTLS